MASAFHAATQAQEFARINKVGDPEDLFVSEIQVNEGPTMRRYKPGAMGRASTIRKRSSHIIIAVADKAGKN